MKKGKKLLIFISIIMTILLVSCEKNPIPGHTHSYSSLWKSNSTSHWHECGCGEKSEALDHTYGSWIIIKEPYKDEKGAKMQVCSECGYENVVIFTEDESDHIHSFSITGYGSVDHFCECSCGAAYQEAHDLKASIIKDSTCKEIGKRLYACICGYSYQVDIALKSHKYENGVCIYCGDKENIEDEDSSEENNNGLSFNLLSDDTYEVSMGSCCDTEIVIPNMFNGKPVTSILDYGFSGFNIYSIVLPKYLKNIGDCAFLDCNKLVEIYNLSSLDITIGSNDNGYIGCYAKVIHTSLEEESNIIRKDDYIFIYDNTDYYLVGYEGTNTELVLPENINGNSYIINDYAFFWEYLFSSIVIPESVKEIKSNAFNFSNLKKIYYCSNIDDWTNVNIEDEVLEKIIIYYYNEDEPKDNNNYWCYDYDGNIIEKKISNQPNLLSFYELVDNTYEVSAGSCYDETITIPKYYNGKLVTSIADYGFFNHSKLTNIILPDSITNIGTYAFASTNIINIDIPTSVTNISSFAFFNCTKLSSIDISGNINIINEGLFQLCSSLSSIQIPESVNTLGEYAFSESGLISIDIPSSIKTIKSSAFMNCVSLENIILKDSVEIIEYGTFAGCINLISIKIPSKITSIDDWFFQNCSSLENILIPKSVTSIGFGAFYACNSLNAIYYTGSSYDWYNISIDDYNSQLNNINIYYYSEIEPTDSGNYWHYVDGIITIW
ncbi:MAG: leucine-rich repeat protein [Anaeroplasmataceae bacterium]